MELLVQYLEQCKIGEWLEGKNIAHELELPNPVVAACFKIYAEKGYGQCSRESGAISYCGRA